MENANRPGLAIVFALSSMMLFGIIDNFMRLVAVDGGLWTFHLLRSIIAVALLLGAAQVMGFAMRPKNLRAVTVRSLLSATAMCIYFGCLGIMPISQVAAGLFTAPIFVVVFSVVFFGEKIGVRRVFAVALGFAGIMLVIRPDTAAFNAVSLVPVLAGAVHAMANIATRRYCGEEATTALLGAFFLTMLIAGAVGTVVLTLFPVDAPPGPDGFVLRGWVRPEGMFAVLIVVQGVGSLIGVGLIIRAYQLAETSFVSVFENMMVVFATVWAVILWNEVPGVSGFVGIICVTLAGVIIAVRSDAPQPVRAPAGVEPS